MELRYDITAVGQNQIRAVIRGVESEILASNKRMTTAIRGTGGPGRSRPMTSGSASGQAQAASRAAISEDAKVWKEKERQAKRFAQIEIQAYEKVARERLAGLKKEEAVRDRLSRSMARGFGRTVSNSVTGMARVGAGAASVAGGIIIGSALNDQAQVQAGASRVANQGMRPDLKPKIAKESQNIKGFTGEESIDALDQFVQKTGDLEAGMGAWKMLGELAIATSTDFKDMGNAAGTAYNFISDSVKDPIERLNQLKDVMTVLAVQGNMSTVEMRDLAPELGKISAAARRFGGDPIVMMKKLAAMGQLAVKRGGATDAAEETTSIGRFVDDLVKDSGSKKAKKNGFVDPFTDKTHTKLRDPVEIVTGIMEKTQGNQGKIGAMFGVRGQRALSGLGNVWQQAHDDAEKKKKGTGNAAGAAAIAGGVGELVGAHKDIKGAANERYGDLDIQIKETTKAFNNAVGTQLLPVVVKLIPTFTELVPAVTSVAAQLARFAEWFAGNPLEGLGSVVLGKIIADLSMAGIGAGVKATLIAMLEATRAGGGGGVPPGVGPGGVPLATTGALGVLGGVGALAGSAIVLGDQLDSFSKETGGKRRPGLGLNTFKNDKGEWSAKESLFNIGIPGLALGKTIASLGESGANTMKQLNTPPSKAMNPQEYDQQAAVQAQLKAAAELSAAAKELAAASRAGGDPARSKPIVAR